MLRTLAAAESVAEYYGTAQAFLPHREMIRVVREVVLDTFQAEISVKECEAAVRTLTMPSPITTNLASTVREAAMLETVMSRPFYVLPSKKGLLAVSLGMCLAAQSPWTRSFLNAEWPFPLADHDDALSKALTRRREATRPEIEFEPLVHAQLSKTGVSVRSDIRPSKRPGEPSSLGVPLRNQIDSLVVDQRRRVIWVIEAKDQLEPFGAREIRNRLASTSSRTRRKTSCSERSRT